MTWSRGFCTAALAGALLFGLQGCGGAPPSDEERLAESDRELTQLRQAVRGAQKDVDDAESGIEESRAELEQAREVLASLRDRLAEAESRVDVAATDALLFRVIQRRLLEDPDLEHVAIRAEVDRGIVTLSGVVPDEATRSRALATVGSYPGLVSVVDKMTLATPIEAPSGEPSEEP